MEKIKKFEYEVHYLCCDICGTEMKLDYSDDKVYYYICNNCKISRENNKLYPYYRRLKQDEEI